MKKITLFLSAAILLAACNNASNSEKVTTTDAQTVQTAEGTTFSIDSTASVTWTGSKPTGKHNGTFKIAEGSLLFNSNTLTGGSFIIDINSLSNTDMAGDAENKGKLEGHLKSPDFFDVAKFPTAKFEITSVELYDSVTDSSAAKANIHGATHLIKGNLTLKDSTKNISFPAKVSIEGNSANAIADFNIDRTLWGMNYKGPENPQDWIISKEVNIKLYIAASKK